jgi:Uma2 family endonuclease
MSDCQRMSEGEYEAFVLSAPEGVWELHEGRLVEKPVLDGARGTVVSRLAGQLLTQLDPAEYTVHVNEARLRAPGETVLIPDVVVLPAEAGVTGACLQLLTRPVPFIVEVWAPPTADYDVDARIPVYQARGDREIWRLHPTERTLTTWVRQRDGTYVETIYQSGMAWPTRFDAPPNGNSRFDA